MKSGLALWICGAALALLSATWASAALAQKTLSLQDNDGAPDAAIVAAVDPATVQDLPSARDYRPPEGIGFKTSDVISENVRLTAQWFRAANSEGETGGRKLPTVIIAPGWGATAASLREDAVDLARAGYQVMLFDYRGWGDSDGRVALAGQPSSAGGASPGQVRELRGYVDPQEQTEDWFNAISSAAADPRVDAERIGILGSDLAGGHVIDVAAHEPRIKALVSLVTRADLRPSKPYQPDPAKAVADANAAASAIASGRAPYPAERGAPVGNKLVRWAPVDDAGAVKAPALFVLAEKEALFSNTFNGQLACERVLGPRKMVILPKITHYGVYGAERTRVITAAIDWFDRYLKPPALKAGVAPAQVPVSRKEPERGACNPPPLPPAGEEKKEGSGTGHKAQATSGRFN